MTSNRSRSPAISRSDHSSRSSIPFSRLSVHARFTHLLTERECGTHALTITPYTVSSLGTRGKQSVRLHLCSKVTVGGSEEGEPLFEHCSNTSNTIETVAGELPRVLKHSIVVAPSPIVAISSAPLVSFSSRPPSPLTSTTWFTPLSLYPYWLSRIHLCRTPCVYGL